MITVYKFHLLVNQITCAKGTKKGMRNDNKAELSWIAARFGILISLSAFFSDTIL